ncbi:MAG: DUF692 domain-containing protein [Burkholderiales bacterium]
MDAGAAADPSVGIGLRQPPAEVGIGLRQPHYAALFETAPPLGFVEVHSENFFADGGAAIAVLHQARESYSVSLHGVGLALGSAAGLDLWHLDRLARLVQRIEPLRVSDHACFARAALAPGAPLVHANDLLPIAFTEASLAIMAGNVMQAQQRIGRTMLVENLSSYVSFADDAMSEPEFFAALCKRTGCGMLLDLNNIMVNALNAGAADTLAACCAYVDALPLGIVGEIHLAGYCETDGIVIDDHGSRVRPAVWAVYEHALRRFGALPTLIEWDTDLPAFELLLGEARYAAGLAARVAA